MVKRLLFFPLLVLPVVAGSPARAQEPVQPDSNIPPLANEFGPIAFQPNSRTGNRAPFLQGAPTHQDGDAAPDVVGAFRFLCEPSWLKTDDPVVAFGKPGKSHLHDGYGAYAIDAYSTYASNRQTLPADPTNPLTPGTSCQNILNLSGYWNPALLTGLPSNPLTKVLRPNFVSVYYKRFPKTSTYCTPGNPNFAGRCVATPNGLAYVFGYDMLTGTPATGAITWKCRNGGQEGAHFDNLVDALAVCPNKANPQPDLALAAVMQAPPCWDGKNTRSANNRSHVAYRVLRGSTPVCPLSHPYNQPAFELGVWWSIYNLPNVDFSGSWYAGKPLGLRLASDVMPGMPEKKPGSTWHADYFEGWDEQTKKEWTDNCIDRHLSCSGGDLGNGTGLKEVQPLSAAVDERVLAKRPKMANEESHATMRGPM